MAKRRPITRKLRAALVRLPRHTTLTETLRECLAASDNILSLVKAIDDDYGVKIQPRSLYRFRDGAQSLRLDVADLLAAHFGIKVVPPKRGKASKR